MISHASELLFLFRLNNIPLYKCESQGSKMLRASPRPQNQNWSQVPWAHVHCLGISFFSVFQMSYISAWTESDQKVPLSTLPKELTLFLKTAIHTQQGKCLADRKSLEEIASPKIWVLAEGEPINPVQYHVQANRQHMPEYFCNYY